MKLLIVFTLALLFGFNYNEASTIINCQKEKLKAFGNNRPQYKINDTNVVLKGWLYRRTFYGPPDFVGSPQTDRKETFYFIRLLKPIDVAPASNDTSGYDELEVNVKYVQLSINNFKDINKHLGQLMIVRGTFGSTALGHIHAKAVIDAETYEIYKPHNHK